MSKKLVTSSFTLEDVKPQNSNGGAGQLIERPADNCDPTNDRGTEEDTAEQTQGQVKS